MYPFAVFLCIEDCTWSAHLTSCGIKSTCHVKDFVRLKASAAAVSSISVSQCGGCACNTAKVHFVLMVFGCSWII